MDPVSQVLAQQQSGSAQGQGFGQFFVAGQQAGLARRRLDLDEKQEARLERRESLMLPLEADLRRAQVINLGIEATLNVQKSRIQNQVNAALPEIAALNMEFMASPSGYADAALRGRVTKLARKYPNAFANGAPGGDLITNIQGAAMFDQKLKQIGGIFDQLKPGESLSLPGGIRVDKDMTKVVQPGTLSTLGKEVTDLSTLEATNPVAALRFREAQAQRDASRNMQTSVTTNPDGTVTTTFSRGATGSQGSGVPAATQSQAIQSLAGQQKTVQMLDDLDRTLRPQDVGAKGVLGEVVLDNLLPQLGFDSADTQRMDSRQKLKLLKEGALRLVTTDSRFSDRDRIAIEKIFPNLGAGQSFPDAKNDIKVLRQVFAKRALIDAATIKQAPPAWALDLMDDDGLVEAENAGLITESDAIAAYRRKRERK